MENVSAVGLKRVPIAFEIQKHVPVGGGRDEDVDRLARLWRYALTPFLIWSDPASRGIREPGQGKGCGRPGGSGDSVPRASKAYRVSCSSPLSTLRTADSREANAVGRFDDESL